MKKIICILLSSILLIGTISFSPAVFATNNEDDPLTLKLNKAQQLEALNEEDFLSDAEDTISWDFNDLEDSLSLEEGIINIGGNGSELQWSNTQNPDITTQNHTYGTHGYIIKKANNSAEENNKIPQKYLSLVYEISKRCDTEYSGDNSSNVALHGYGNYIVNIAYLWRLAKKIGAHYSEVTNATDANIKAFISEMADEAYDNMPVDDLSDSARKQLYNLYTIAPKVLKKYYKTASIANYSGQSWNGRCKYIIYGMLSHSIGDLFAHRVLLKPNAADYLIDSSITFNPKTMLDPDFFISDYFNVEKLKNDVPNGNVMISHLKGYVLEDELTEAVTKEKQKLAHSNYADNPTFYPKRINEAIYALSFFIDTYLDGHSVREIIDYSGACVTPVEGFNLQNFAGYKKHLGI